MNAGGALHTSTKVFGDLYPTMLVRLAFRHIQYALVACEHEWVSEEGVRTFATLLKEIDTEATTFLFFFLLLKSALHGGLSMSIYFSKGLCIVASCRKCTRALTFENVAV